MATKTLDKPVQLNIPADFRRINFNSRELIELNVKRRLDFQIRPELIYPWWRRCTVSVLLVADDSLNFGEGDFGLSTFVRTLNRYSPNRVRFELTLAHIDNVTNSQLLDSEPGIANRIKNFRFDNPVHFTAEMYDQIWLFGIDTSYAGMPDRSTFLAPTEINAIHAHMQRGGGVFATGDHGYLGQSLCGAIPRVRNMRYWGDFPSSSNNLNQVSMTGPRRNDTNQAGHDAGTQFSDQSDDIPQSLDLVLYSSYAGFFRNARYPHPLLCGRTGRIDVFPDHPHEGECRVPPDVTLKIGGVDEYPVDASGTRVVPEVIAWSRVPAGNTTRPSSGPNAGKTPTIAHTFGAISAYDGHRAGGIGRVVCDATWHHFVNVNLIGVVEGGGFDEFSNPDEHSSKHEGFLSSPAGLAVLEKIKNYYTNIGLWIAPPAKQNCFHSFIWWEILYSDRIVEATLTSPDILLERIPASTLMQIGIHARDVLGRKASQCQTLEWLIGWVKEFVEVAWLDPWDPVTRVRLEKGEAPLPIHDPMPLVDVALGAALVSLRQQFPKPPTKLTARQDDAANKAVRKGAQYGIRLAAKLAQEQSDIFAGLLRNQSVKGS